VGENGIFRILAMLRLRVVSKRCAPCSSERGKLRGLVKNTPIPVERRLHFPHYFHGYLPPRLSTTTNPCSTVHKHDLDLVLIIEEDLTAGPRVFFFVYSLLACDLWRSWRDYVQSSSYPLSAHWRHVASTPLLSG